MKSILNSLSVTDDDIGLDGTVLWSHIAQVWTVRTCKCPTCQPASSWCWGNCHCSKLQRSSRNIHPLIDLVGIGKCIFITCMSDLVTHSPHPLLETKNSPGIGGFLLSTTLSNYILRFCPRLKQSFWYWCFFVVHNSLKLFFQDYAKIHEADEDTRLQGQECVRRSSTDDSAADWTAPPAVYSLCHEVLAAHRTRCCWHISKIWSSIKNPEATQPVGGWSR